MELPGNSVRQSVTGGIADRQFRMLPGIFCALSADSIQTVLDAVMIQTGKYGDKFISTISADKIFSRDSDAQLLCKGADVGIPSVVSKIVIDGAQVIKIKYAQGGGCCVICRQWLIQNLFTFIFIWQSGSFIQIDLLLQQTVLGGIMQRFDQLKRNQDY